MIFRKWKFTVTATLFIIAKVEIMQMSTKSKMDTAWHVHIVEYYTQQI